MSDLQNTVKESFIQYSGAVLQSRALVDVRDCLKPSARQIFYSMLEHKLVHKNPYKKTANAVGLAMVDFYIHGDSSCEGVIMRAGQDFAMRYPLVEVSGNMGSLMESGNWAAMRYTESRLSQVSDILFSDIKKDTIEEWRDNYDNTKQYPSVLPSKGFYNIVNGTTGIGIGMASSIPQFNIKEVNEALIKLLWNPDIDFEDIYCAPDFATGAILLNENEVKESLKNGQGFSCKLRSVVDYDSTEKCFIITEIPYGVYTNTICGQIEEIINSEDNPGIDKFKDLTGATPLIKIYLTKKANANKVLKYLYKNTSLQSHFGINMTMLDNGRFPKVFTWKTALQAHIDHEIEVYTRGYEFDVRKIKDRLHIIDGLIIAMANIDEVVKTIKSSASTIIASSELQKNFLLDEAQAKAILDMKLSRLAKLEVQKLEREKNDLETELDRLLSILNNEELLKKEIEKGLREVINKFGDSRRTQILNIEKEEDEPIEVKSVQVSLTNQNNLLVSEVSTLYTQRRGGVGNKFKLNKGEFIISTASGQNVDVMLIFTSGGNVYNYPLSQLPLEEKTPIESIISIRDSEKVCAITTTNKKNTKNNIIFFTKNGILKKSKIKDYSSNRSGGLKAISLDSSDEIVSVLIMDEEPVGMLTEQGNFIIVDTKNISAIGRVAKGRKGIKLNSGDFLVSAKTLPSTANYILSITKDGFAKRSSLEEFNKTALNTKGVKLQKFKSSDDKMVDFEFINNENSIMAVASKTQIKINLNEVPLLLKGAIGNRLIKLNQDEKIIGISKG